MLSVMKKGMLVRIEGRRSAALVGALAHAACGGAAPQPAAPPPNAAPEPAPVAEPAPTPVAEPAPAPEEPIQAQPTLTGDPKPWTDQAPSDAKACSVWSGGPLGDAPPPKGYDPNPCGPNMYCQCTSQAGYSCGGFCRPR